MELETGKQIGYDYMRMRREMKEMDGGSFDLYDWGIFLR